MVILPALAFLYLVSMGMRAQKGRVSALMDGTVLLFALAVVIAELTSLFTAYNLLWVSLCWALIVCLLGAAQYRAYHTISPIAKGLFAVRGNGDRWERGLLALLLGTAAVAFLKCVLAPPGAPTDSVVYHLPRAFMFYKDQSIHNFACSSGHMLYFGPLNAILMSQLQILCFGWDGLAPFVQYIAYLLCMLGVYQITLLMCQNRKYALIGGALACFMPMAHMQASTTQSDLLVTAFCVTAVYLMATLYCRLRAGKRAGLGQTALLGLCCGLAVLSKLSAGPTLLGFCAVFAVYLLWKQRAKGVVSGVLILACALLMTCGFWARNARDWNGDFLPASYAGSRPDYQSIGVKGTALISAKAIATTFTDPIYGDVPPFTLLQKASYGFAAAAARCLGLPLDAEGTRESAQYFTGRTSPISDHVSYPLHAFLVLVLLPVAIVYAGVKKRWTLMLYGLCVLLGVAVTSTQYLWCTSYNRYLTPPFMLAFPLCAYMLQRMTGRSAAGKKAVIVLLACMFGLNALLSSYLLKRYVEDIFIEKHTQGERVLNEHTYYPLRLWREVTADVEANGYTKIGLNHAGAGDYIWLRPFAAPKYQVRYLHASVRPDLESQTYVPDCYIGVYPAGEAPAAETYHGVLYQRKFEPSSVFGEPEGDPVCFAYYVRTEGV